MNWAYIAGFFDGEGSISHINPGKIAWRATITQGERRVLENIAEFLESQGVKGIIFHKEVRKRKDIGGQQYTRRTRRAILLLAVTGLLLVLLHKRPENISEKDRIPRDRSSFWREVSHHQKIVREAGVVELLRHRGTVGYTPYHREHSLSLWKLPICYDIFFRETERITNGKSLLFGENCLSESLSAIAVFFANAFGGTGINTTESQYHEFSDTCGRRVTDVLNVHFDRGHDDGLPYNQAFVFWNLGILDNDPRALRSNEGVPLYPSLFLHFLPHLLANVCVVASSPKGSCGGEEHPNIKKYFPPWRLVVAGFIGIFGTSWGWWTLRRERMEIRATFVLVVSLCIWGYAVYRLLDWSS